MNLIFDGVLKPVIGAVMPLEQAREAQERLESFDVIGKVVLQL